MNDRLKIYRCRFRITALVKAWLWRREGRFTSIGKMMEVSYLGLDQTGYWVTGVFRDAS